MPPKKGKGNAKGAEEEPPVVEKKSAPPKKKGNKKRGDDSDDEELNTKQVDLKKSQNDDDEEVPQPSKSKKKQQKRQQRKQGKGANVSDDEDASGDEDSKPAKNAPASKKKQDDDDEEDEDIPQPASKNKKQQKKQQQKTQKKGKNANVSDDEEEMKIDAEDDQDDEEIPQPAKGKKKQQQKKQQQKGQKQQPAKGKKDDSDEEVDLDNEDDEEEEIPQPASKNKKQQKKQQQKTQKKGGKNANVSDDEADNMDVDEEEEDEEDEIPQPSAKNKKKQQKKQQQKAQKSGKKSTAPVSDDEEDEDDEDEEEVAPAKTNQKNTQGKGKTPAPAPKKGGPVNPFASLEDEDEVDEDDEEDEAEKAKAAEQARVEAAKKQAEEEAEARKLKEKKDKEDAEAASARKLREEEARKAKKAAKREKKNKDPSISANANSSKSESTLSDEMSNLAIDEERKGSESMSKDIKIEKFDISFPGKVLFKDATLLLAHGRKYGLVAPNGTGKSTLLNNIARRENEFIGIPKHFDIHYVEQEVVGDDTPAITSVIEADVERTRLLADEKRLMEGTSDDDSIGEKLQRIHGRLDEIEAYSAEARASSILTGLQFSEEMKHKPTKDFSGGWRMRIALARALFRRPTLLLLDEPTNHLDLLAVIWLETYLHKWKNTLLIVSHDQDFLNSICTDVIHVYQQKLNYYKGNYDNFKHVFTDSISQQRKAYEKQQKLIKQLQQQKSKKNEKTKSADKVKDSHKVIRNKQMAADKAKKTKDDPSDGSKGEILAPVPRDYTVVFEFPDPDALSIPIIQVNDASFGYDPSKILFSDLNFGIDLESRIALVGPNGAGKSTLIKLLTGELQPIDGSVQRNRKLIIGKFAQHFVDALDMSVSPVDYLQQRFPEYTIPELRKFVGRFGLTGQTQLQRISSLSGGQKSRVVFAEICMKNPHLLFLDEPTNHLDLESIEALAEALNEFKGGLVLVSHDARLITQLNCDIWVVNDNKVEIFDGDFEDYRNDLIQEFEERIEQEELDRKEKEDARRKKREEEMKAKFEKK